MIYNLPGNNGTHKVAESHTDYQTDTYPYPRPHRLRILAACTDAAWYEKLGHVAVKPEYFNTKEEQSVARFINDFYKGYGRTPTLSEYEAEYCTKDELYLDLIAEIWDAANDNLDYTKGTAVEFAKVQARWIALDQGISRFQHGEDSSKIIQALNAAEAITATGWSTKTVNLDYIYKPEYLVGDICAAGWLVVFYGSAKCLKSMLIQDMIVCAASGVDWLDDTPTHPSKVLYLDFDAGMESLEGHIAASCRAHGVTDTSNIHIESFPTNPTFNAVNEASILHLTDLIKKNGYNILVIDHFLNASGVDDEKGSSIATAMANLRKVIKATGILIILIAHTPKDSANTTVRGHGSITDGADMTYLVEREAGTDIITVTCTNPRHYKPDSFSAQFVYESYPSDERILMKYRMTRLPYQPVKNSQNRGKSNVDKSDVAYKWTCDNIDSILERNLSQAKRIICEGCQVGDSYADNAITRCIKAGTLIKVQDGKNKVLKPGMNSSTAASALKLRLEELKRS